MILTPTPRGSATRQAIEMMTQDKGVFADAVGALSPWHMCGTPELLVTDSGSENVSFDVRLACRDIGMNVEHAPGGVPDMRGSIERLFGTISQKLMPRLTGRTFSNMIERGDYDSGARAALTADDLAAVLVRWAVDIYHRTPQRGLNGETPMNCWNRLVETYGVTAPPGLHRRRFAFGTRMSRTVGRDGITVLGVRYHSEELARLILRRRDRKVALSWYAGDLGAISVEIDGEWIEVPAVFEQFQGARAETWIAARREMRARFQEQAAVDESVVFQAIADIEAINGAAMRRAGIVADDWNEKRVQANEDRLFIGFSVAADRIATPQTTAVPGYGEAYETAMSDLSLSPPSPDAAGRVAEVVEIARRRNLRVI
jgi:putative transposase